MSAANEQHTAVIRAAAPRQRRRRSKFTATITDARTATGLIILAFILIVVFGGRFFAPHGNDEFIAPPYSAPSPEALLGTDYMGQDVLSRVLLGGETVVWMSVLAATIGVVFGVLLGMVAGFKRGWIEQIIMRLSDVAMAIPVLVVTLLFVSLLGRNLMLITLIVGIAHAPQVARIVRAVTAEVAGHEYIESAVALGSSTPRTVITQILPNLTGTVMVEYGLRIVWSIIAIAGLSVLGQGVAAPQADWGLMINENRGGLATQPWAVIAPLAMIALYALAVNLIAEGIGRAQQVGHNGASI